MDYPNLNLFSFMYLKLIFLKYRLIIYNTLKVLKEDDNFLNREYIIIISSKININLIWILQ